MSSGPTTTTTSSTSSTTHLDVDHHDVDDDHDDDHDPPTAPRPAPTEPRPRFGATGTRRSPVGELTPERRRGYWSAVRQVAPAQASSATSWACRLASRLGDAVAGDVVELVRVDGVVVQLLLTGDELDVGVPGRAHRVELRDPVRRGRRARPGRRRPAPAVPRPAASAPAWVQCSTRYACRQVLTAGGFVPSSGANERPSTNAGVARRRAPRTSARSRRCR